MSMIELPLPLDTPLRSAGLIGQQVRLNISGPRRWWGGPLDVEGLALSSVGLAAGTLSSLTGRPVGVSAPAVAHAFNSLALLKVNGQSVTGFAELSGFFATADGWLRTHANYPHHREALLGALGADSYESLCARLRTLSALDAESMVLAGGGVAAAVRGRRQWLHESDYPARTCENWVDFTLADAAGSPPGAWVYKESANSPLEGLRVLDFTRVIAGPTASRLLGALGADVLRVDAPHHPELLDHHLDTGFSRRSALADMRQPGDYQRIRELLAGADVVLLGYRNGAFDAFGLSPEDIRSDFPHTVIVTFDAWGDKGLRAHSRGFDSIVQAACGIAELYADETGRPGALPVQALDHATGYGIVASALALLESRQLAGAAGTAHLSLVHAADLLCAARQAPGRVGALGQPCYTRAESSYGQLEFVGPPLACDGVPVSHRWPPRVYGADALKWLDH